MWACDPAVTGPILDSYQVAGPLFVNALQSFLAAHCALVGDHLWPEDASDAVDEDPNYDFIVVGAGSAGAVVANRLTEVPDWKVLLIEAGGNPNLATEMPRLFLANLNTEKDWGYRTQPHDGSCRSYKKKGCAWPRGKVLGGSSSINAMFYVRGNKLDYDEWAANGNTGWSYADILQYFRKSENISLPLTSAVLKHHGTNGYLHVEAAKHDNIFETIAIKANEELGIRVEDDINGNNQMGITRSQSTTKNGIRHSSARAFLSPIKDRPNLHVLKDSYVTKLVFANNSREVRGVVIDKNGKSIVVNIKKEVILSAGTINTPQLLLLSGIGPREHLEKFQVNVKADLPVGKNLQDHAFVPIYYTLETNKELTSLPNIIKAMSDYILSNHGPFSDLSPNKVIGFINTTDPTSQSPDIQHHYFYIAPNQKNIIDGFQKHGLSEEFNRKLNDINEHNFVLAICTVLLKPKSKGRIMLTSKDPNEHPLIYANYFDDPDDLQTIVNGMKFALKLAETKTFKDAGFKLHWIDLEACKKYNNHSDDFLECMARETTFSLYHPVGTVKMGPDNDPEAVVDYKLKVKSISRLRVIDASIMPTITRGNTNAPTIMIGEKGADFIKKDWLKSNLDSKQTADTCQNNSMFLDGIINKM